MTMPEKLEKARTIVETVFESEGLLLEFLEQDGKVQIAVCDESGEVVVTLDDELCDDLDESYRIQGAVAHALEINFSGFYDSDIGDKYQIRIR